MAPSAISQVGVLARTRTWEMDVKAIKYKNSILLYLMAPSAISQVGVLARTRTWAMALGAARQVGETGQIAVSSRLMAMLRLASWCTPV